MARSESTSEAVFDDLFGLACLAGWSLNTDTTGIADGARYIRPNLEECFRVRRPDLVQVAGSKPSPFQLILDRPHAKAHLALAGEMLAPREKTSLSEWIHEKIHRIDQGQVHEVITYLRRKAKQLGNAVLLRTPWEVLFVKCEGVPYFSFFSKSTTRPLLIFLWFFTICVQRSQSSACYQNSVS